MGGSCHQIASCAITCAREKQIFLGTRLFLSTHLGVQPLNLPDGATELPPYSHRTFHAALASRESALFMWVFGCTSLSTNDTPAVCKLAAFLVCLNELGAACCEDIQATEVGNQVYRVKLGSKRHRTWLDLFCRCENKSFHVKTNSHLRDSSPPGVDVMLRSYMSSIVSIKFRASCFVQWLATLQRHCMHLDFSNNLSRSPLAQWWATPHRNFMYLIVLNTQSRSLFM